MRPPSAAPARESSWNSDIVYDDGAAAAANASRGRGVSDDGPTLYRGMLVRHKQYGEGQLIRWDGSGANLKLHLRFPGVGDKTAAALVERFGSLEGIVAALDGGTDDGFPAGARAKLEAARDYLAVAPAVSRVVCDLPLPAYYDALPLAPRDPAALVALSDRWGLDSPLERFLQSLEVARTGLSREDAYSFVQAAAMKTWESGRPFRETLTEQAELAGQKLDEARLDEVCRPERYLARLAPVFERLAALT